MLKEMLQLGFLLNHGLVENDEKVAHFKGHTCIQLVFLVCFNVLMPRVKKYSHYKPAGSKANLGGSCIYYKE